MNTPGYESLSEVLHRAYKQAAQGKGAERHACARPFTEQPMQSISGLLGSHTGLLYQAMKKIQESERMDKDAAVRELLGAINYVAGAIIFMEAKQPSLTGMTKPGYDLEALARFVCPPEPARILSEEQMGIATENLQAQMATHLGTHWICTHGGSGSQRFVPIGEACPACFSTHS